ncbi:MAG: hypothetical protein ACXADY_01865 [Candidatus Hodarchaeales archaeon]|jgi:hypothetical protein
MKGNPSFWDEYDLKVDHTLFSSDTENNEAILSGKIGINCGSDTKTITLFNAAAKGESIEPLIIGTLQRGDRYSTIVPKDSGHTWSDLMKLKERKLDIAREQELMLLCGDISLLILTA